MPGNAWQLGVSKAILQFLLRQCDTRAYRTPRPPLRALRQRQPRRQHRDRPRTARRRPACSRRTTAARYRAGGATRAALPMPALRRTHDRHRGVRTRLRAEVAADAEQVRHVMSRTSSARRRFPVPLRWLHAGGDLSQPDSWQSMRPAPVDTLQTQPGTLLPLSRPPPRAGMQVASPQCRASIECAANLKSP